MWGHGIPESMFSSRDMSIRERQEGRRLCCRVRRCWALCFSNVLCTPGVSLQLLQQRFGLLKIGGVKPLGAPAVDRREELVGLSALALLLPQTTEAHGRDCPTPSEAALRMLIDTVGIDRVVFGTDWPADMAIGWPVACVLGLESLTQEEKAAILYHNLEQLLGI